MSNVLSRAFKIIFDFKRDVSDLTERLEKAENTILRQVNANTELEEQLAALAEENETLRETLTRLQTELRELKNFGI